MQSETTRPQDLLTRPVSVYDRTFRQARALYREAFPAQERFPIALLQVAAWKPEVEFMAYCDPAEPETVVGIAFTIDAAGYLYLLYLAVRSDARGGGYGTRILHQLQRAHPGATFVLEVEPLDPKADNYEQRVARYAFYDRNGFVPVGYDMLERHVLYTMLATDEDFDADDFAAAMRKLSHGLYRFSIVPSEPGMRLPVSVEKDA